MKRKKSLAQRVKALKKQTQLEVRKKERKVARRNRQPAQTSSVAWLLKQDDETWARLLASRNMRLWGIFYKHKVRPLTEPKARIVLAIREGIDKGTLRLHQLMMSNPQFVKAWAPSMGNLAKWMLRKHGFEHAATGRHYKKQSKRLVKAIWPSTTEGQMEAAIRKLHAPSIALEGVHAKQEEPDEVGDRLRLSWRLSRSLVLAYIQLWPWLERDFPDGLLKEVHAVVSEAELGRLHKEADDTWLERHDEISRQLMDYVGDDARKRHGSKEQARLLARQDELWVESFRWRLDTKVVKELFLTSTATANQMKKRYLDDLYGGHLVLPPKD